MTAAAFAPAAHLADFVWVDSLPRLEITHTKTSEELSSLVQVFYTVKSAARLGDDDFDWLIDKGFLMKGDLFYCYSQCDGKEPVAGRWTVDGKSWVEFYSYEVMCQGPNRG